MDGRGAALTMPWPDPGDHVDVQVANPPATRVRLAYPRVLLKGPWTLEFARG